MIDALPKDLHPMTQLTIGTAALQQGSQFHQKYSAGAMSKTEYWEYTLEDSLTLCAQTPILAARIFRNVFFDGKHIEADTSLDWAANYAHMLGIDDSDQFKD